LHYTPSWPQKGNSAPFCVWLVRAPAVVCWLILRAIVRSLTPSPCHSGQSYHRVRHRRSPRAAMASKKVDETTTLRGDADGDEKLPEWVVKYGAPLAITFYILVAVVKTMLTKVRLGTSTLAAIARRSGLLRVCRCSCLAGPLRGWRGVPCRLLCHLGHRHVHRAHPRLPHRPHTVGSAQEGLHARCANAIAKGWGWRWG
jgi:hypothetical protein